MISVEAPKPMNVLFVDDSETSQLAKTSLQKWRIPFVEKRAESPITPPTLRTRLGQEVSGLTKIVTYANYQDLTLTE